MKREKTFTLRIDLESDKGIKAVPKLLDLLKKYNIRASFYLVMGGGPSLLDLIKYRKKLENTGERKIKVWTLKDKLRIVLFPKDFVRKNKKILNRILDEGHELGLHGWKHRAWTRGFNRISIRSHIDKSLKKYQKVFRKKPVSWSSPGFNINRRVLRELERAGIQFISDFSGEKLEFYDSIRNVPITIKGKDNKPVIEYLAEEEKTDEEIIEEIKKQIKEKRLASFYIHGLYEGRFKLNLLERIFKIIKKEKIRSKRIVDYQNE